MNSRRRLTPDERIQRQRIMVLKDEPFLFDQGDHGFCAFAAVIMSLLEHDPGEFERLLNCVNGIGSYKGVMGALVKNRIKKRVKLELIPSSKVNYSDTKLGIGLMIIFKEYLKTHNKITVWDECIKFSKSVVGEWIYSGDGESRKKLKDMIKDRTVLSEKLQKMSYKHGDFGVTVDACAEMVKMVYGEKLKNLQKKDLKNRDKCNNIKDMAAHNDSIETDISETKKYMTSSNKRFAIFGMGECKPSCENGLQTYKCVVHYVYIPQYKNKVIALKTAEKAMIAWTWGVEYSVYKDQKIPLGMGLKSTNVLYRGLASEGLFPVYAILCELK